MICPSCRKAGELNKLLPAEGGMKQVKVMIRSLHHDCPKGNWCDCQHVIGQVLNPLMTGDKNAVSE